MSARLRKIDRSILTSSPDTFLDSDDQDQLINQLYHENQQSYTNYNRFLALLILVELPIFTYVHHAIHQRQYWPIMTLPLIVTSNLLALIQIMYKLNHIQLRVSHWFNQRIVRVVTSSIFSWWGINIINLIINCELVYIVWQHWPGAYLSKLMSLICLMPLFNLVMINCLNKWFEDVVNDLMGLNQLKYKFKTV